MPHKFHPQRRHPLRVPGLFKRENAEEQVVVPRQLVGPARARGPDLGRDELNDLGIPLGKRVFPDVVLDRLAEAQVESAVVHADDHIRFPFDRQRKQLVEQPPEFEEVFEDVGDADDGVLGQIKGESDAGRSHLGSARAEKDG